MRMNKYTLAIVDREWGSTAYAHAFGKDHKQVLKAAKAMYDKCSFLIFEGHCQAADKKDAQDFAERAQAVHDGGRVSGLELETLKLYLAWLADPEAFAKVQAEVAERKSREKTVAAFIRKEVGGKVELYEQGDFPQLYRSEFGYPDFLFYDKTGSCLFNETTREFHANTAKGLSGVDPGYMAWKGCRKTYNVPGVGDVTIDFWALRHWQDES